MITEPPPGHHFIFDTQRGAVAVETLHRAGLYAVHLSGYYSYSVTHTPSGGRCCESLYPDLAKQQAEHFHKTAGDAGKDCALGEIPTGEDDSRMRAAYNSRPVSLDRT